jgi:catechol 2,3-dioxygenase-like lactoylglutathione lyase family enzyme
MRDTEPNPDQEADVSTTTEQLIRGVDFVYVGTQDFERAVDFYGNVLGLPQSARYGRKPGAEFETGTLTLAVIESEAFGLEFSPNRNAIALHVDDVEAARSALESRGVQFAGDTIDSGVCHMAFFSDPDENGLLLHHRYAPRGSG